MGRAPQNLAAAPVVHLIIAGVIAIVLFFVGIILSYAGPVAETTSHDTLYKCPDGKHTWSDQCRGTPTLKEYTYEITRLRVTGGYFGAIMQPYYVSNASVDNGSSHKLTLHVTVTSSSTDKSGYWKVVKVSNKTFTFDCKKNGACNSVIVEHSNVIRHSGQKYRYEFYNAEETQHVGDVIFSVERGNEKRSTLVLTFDVIYIIIAFLLFLGFGFCMKNFALDEWSLSQKFTVLLAFGFILYNAPFLSLDYALRSSFLVLIGTILRIFFFAFMFFYWILLADNIASKEPFSLKDKMQLIRLAVLLAYVIVSVIAFGWLNIADHHNPVMNHAESIPGVIAFVIISDIIFAVIIVYIGINLALSLRGALANSQTLIAYIFQVAPIAVVALSMFIGLFLNNYGVVNHKRSDLFFSTLYLTYVLLLAFISFPGVLFSFKFANNVETTEDEERNEFVKSSKIVDKEDADDDEDAKSLI